MTNEQNQGQAFASRRDTVKVTVNLPGETVQVLRSLAADRGISLTETVRQAIEGERILREEVRLGGKVLIERPGGTRAELVFR